MNQRLRSNKEVNPLENSAPVLKLIILIKKALILNRLKINQINKIEQILIQHQMIKYNKKEEEPD